MAKKRVHEIAKERGMSSKEVIAKLQAAGFEVKAAASSIEEAVAAKALGANGSAPAAPAAATPKPAAPAKPGPVTKDTPKAAAAPAAPAAQTPQPAAPAKPGAAPTPPAAAAAAKTGPPRPTAEPRDPGEPEAPSQPPPAPRQPTGPRAVNRPPGSPPPGTGRPIISVPEPPPKPKRDETAAAKRPVRSESGPGGGRRRVVIDSQAARRGPGGPGGPGGGPQQGPPRRQRRGRRRRGTYDDTVQPLDVNAQSATDVFKVNSGSTVKEVAEHIGVPVPDVIKKLMMLGEMATLTQTLADEAIQVIADEFDKKIEIVHLGEESDDEPAFEDDAADLSERPPVVTIMGHVDHGKTSLLDAVRSADVVAGEAGGITQHIGAYQVHHNDKVVTFLDTPGHEAFTAMRARGAKVTDIAVIVVAADDGVMPQTVEAIDHAKAAEVPVMVAVNKIDKEGADPNRVRGELAQQGLTPADWGGDTEFVDVSAKTHQNLDDLLETLVTLAEIQELRANPDAEASGFVIESRLDPGRGPVVTLLVNRGRMKVSDSVVAGEHWGRVRAMQDFRGDAVEEATPGMPVEILGFDGVPDAGETFRVVPNDREAKRVANERSIRVKQEALARQGARRVSLEDVLARAERGEKELNLVLKADVAGSLEALADEIVRLPQDQVQVNIIREGVGGIAESDVMLAAASDGIIIGFNVRPVGNAGQVAEREGVEIRTYSVIYNIIEELRAAMEGLLDAKDVEEAVGAAEVRATFKASRVGTIAGCYVTDGVLRRGVQCRLVRDGTVVYDGRIGSLRRFKDDVREVTAGMECGVVLENYPDPKEGDVIEAYEIKQVEQTLG